LEQKKATAGNQANALEGEKGGEWKGRGGEAKNRWRRGKDHFRKETRKSAQI